MQISRLPNPISRDDVEPGSLVRIPGEHKWAICTDDNKLFQLETYQPANVNGAVADFGNKYRVTFELDTCERLTYPWFADGLPRGSLCIYPENGSIRTSIALVEAGDTLQVLDLMAGAMKQRTSHDPEGLSFQRWGIELRTDAPNTYKSVYEFTG